MSSWGIHPMRSSIDAERISTVGFRFVGPFERELVAGDWVLRRCSVCGGDVSTLLSVAEKELP